MQPRHIVTAFAVIALGTAAVAPADAAKKKKPQPFSGSQKVTDVTADPSGSTTDGPDCSSQVPSDVEAWQDDPISIKVPAIGKLKVTLENNGDWALEVRDPKGTIVGFSDGGGPLDLEQTTVKTKKVGTYKLWACNLGGHPEALAKWTWTPA